MQRMATKDIAHRTTNTREKKTTFHFRRRVSLILYNFGFESNYLPNFQTEFKQIELKSGPKCKRMNTKKNAFLFGTHKKKTIFVRTNVSDYKPKHRVTVIT